MPGMSRDIVYEDDKLAGWIPNHALCYLDELLWTERVGTPEQPGRAQRVHSSACTNECKQKWSFMFLSLDFATAPRCRSEVG
jgi:hypothetical protein